MKKFITLVKTNIDSVIKLNYKAPITKNAPLEKWCIFS